MTKTERRKMHEAIHRHALDPADSISYWCTNVDLVTGTVTYGGYDDHVEAACRRNLATAQAEWRRLGLV